MKLSEVKERVGKIKSAKSDFDIVECGKIKLYEDVISYFAKKYSGIDGDILKEVDKLRGGGFGD